MLRAIPEVVWALVFVRALGLGPGAGVLALAITYGGMLGKVYAEILESGDTRPARALLEAGSGRAWRALFYGLVPGAAQELASYTVYRWECAVRASVVMGFVGAGGLGQLMDQSMKMLNGGEASTILLTFLLLVLLADALSAGAAARAGMSAAAVAHADGAARRGRRAAASTCVRGCVAALAGRRGGRELRLPRRSTTARSSAPSRCALMGKFVAEFFPPDLSRGVPRQGGLGRAADASPCRRSAPCSRCVAGALLALPAAGRFGSAPRAGARASCSTSCAACPSWCGRR